MTRNVCSIVGLDDRAPSYAPSGGIEMDLDLLKGTWRAIRIETAGGPVPGETAATVRYIFDDDRVRLLEGDQPAGEGVIHLDTEADPRAFDFTATAGLQAGTTARGIYRIDGDRLVMCLGSERPAAFRAAGDAALIELERIA
jgi:uncharacterized protein (TIGR03067 family)